MKRHSRRATTARLCDRCVGRGLEKMDFAPTARLDLYPGALKGLSGGVVIRCCYPTHTDIAAARFPPAK